LKSEIKIILDNEKDIFDLFRESSEDFTEQPPVEAWTRLEKRLVTVRKRKRPLRKSLQLQLPAIALAILLLLLVAVSWFFTHQHQEILRGRKEFSQFHFLQGSWVASEKKTMDKLTWAFKDSFTLVGEKSLYFTDDLLSKMPVVIKNLGQNNVLIFNNKTYKLKEIVRETFIFKSKDKEEVRLRRADDDRFTLSFGEGMIFVFKRA
jgi:hypothetical protein